MTEDFQRVEAHACPMSTCAAPPGSPCRTGKNKVAIQYHTARFRLVPQLAKVLSVPTPAVRKPGSVWTELPRPARAGAEPAGHVRLGYARASTARQSLDAQLDSLTRAGVTRIFSEKISTRATRRPELEAAVKLAGEIRSSGAAVTLVVHEHKRLGRGIELAMLAEELKASDVGLEFLTGELKGSHDPSGIVFTVLAAMSGMEREYIRDRTLEGHESARRRGKTIGGASVTDGDMLSMALHLRDQEMSLRDIAKRLVITTGKKKGQHPSPATVLRMLREHDGQQTAPAAVAERAHQAAPAAHHIADPRATPTATVRGLTAPPSERPAAPELLSSRDASPLPVGSAAAHPRTETSPADPVSAPTEEGTHREAAAPRPRRRTQSSRDGSRPSAAPEETPEGIRPRPQGLSQRAARQIADSAELVRNPDYRDTHRATVRSGATVLGYVEPSYGGTSASGRNGWIGSVAPGSHGPVRKTQQQAAADVALSWIRIVTAKPRRADD